MFNYLSFIFFSTVEFIGIIFLGITLFRLRLYKKEYIKALLFCIFLSVVSLILRINIASVAPIVVLILYLVLLKFILNTDLIKSYFIGFVSYFIFIFIQASVFVLFDKYDIIPEQSITMYSNSGYLLQMLTFIVLMLISFVTRYIKEGFSFDPDFSSYKNRVVSNKLFLMITSVSLIILAYLYFELFMSDSIKYVYLTFIAASLITLIILTFSYIRDLKETNHYQSRKITQIKEDRSNDE